MPRDESSDRSDEARSADERREGDQEQALSSEGGRKARTGTNEARSAATYDKRSQK